MGYAHGIDMMRQDAQSKLAEIVVSVSPIKEGSAAVNVRGVPGDIQVTPTLAFWHGRSCQRSFWWAKQQVGFGIADFLNSWH